MENILSKSPMQESVLHIRCDYSSVVCGSDDKVVSQLKELFSTDGLVYEHPIIRVDVPRPLKDGKGAMILPPPEQHRCGERFRSEDGRRIVQVFSDGVAISWLKPYDSWKSFTSFAFSIWGKLTNLSGSDIRIDRIGLRAINRITLPDGADPVPSMLIGREMPQSLSGLCRDGFLACDTLRDPATGASANITRTYETNQDAKGRALVFDIDAFYLPRCVMKEAEMLRGVENLHDLRDRIFFAEISDKARECFA